MGSTSKTPHRISFHYQRNLSVGLLQKLGIGGQKRN
jgi:hypothetical protein